jgi:membrane-associated protease RseP (regulator of RpoE activity)
VEDKMRNRLWMSMVVVLALSLLVTGAALAQGGRGNRGQAGAWLGINFTEAETGVTVSSVLEGSPAADAGLLEGDVIVSVDEQTVDSGAALIEMVRSHQPGDVIAITISRAGSEQTLDVELGSSPMPGDFNADMTPLEMASRVLHVQLSEVDEGYQVEEGRMPPQGELAAGDVITAVNGAAVAEVDWQSLQTELAGQDNPTLTLTVQRDGEEISVELTQFGDMHQHGPMGDRPDQADQNGAPPSDGTNPQTGTAPHAVAPGATCDQCHGTTPDTNPAAPSGGSSDGIDL